MKDHQIIIFDGQCHFCNGAVNFIIKRDSRAVFKFVPMQHDLAQQLMEKYRVSEVAPDSFLLIRHETCFLRTKAALEVIRELDGYWFLLRVFNIVPAGVRDFFYKAFARNRYRLFGKRSACIVPSQSVRDRFMI